MIQVSNECLDFFKLMELNDDQISRSLFQRKMKQYEN